MHSLGSITHFITHNLLPYNFEINICFINNVSPIYL